MEQLTSEHVATIKNFYLETIDELETTLANLKQKLETRRSEGWEVLIGTEWEITVASSRLEAYKNTYKHVCEILNIE